MTKLQEMAPEELARVRKQFGIPEDADLTILEMERHVPFDMWGWTDDMIEGMPVEKIEALIEARRPGLVRLQETVDTERREIMKLELILQRKLVLGDS